MKLEQILPPRICSSHCFRKKVLEKYNFFSLNNLRVFLLFKIMIITRLHSSNICRIFLQWYEKRSCINSWVFSVWFPGKSPQSFFFVQPHNLVSRGLLFDEETLEMLWPLNQLFVTILYKGGTTVPIMTEIISLYFSWRNIWSWFGTYCYGNSRPMKINVALKIER